MNDLVKVDGVATGVTLSNYFQNSPLLYTREGLPAFMGDTYQGRSAFIVAGGPSLKAIDMGQLVRPGCLTMGINNAVKACRTDLWVSIGDPSHFMKSIWLDAKIMKFVSIAYAYSTIFDNEKWEQTEIQVRECPNVYFFQPNADFDAEDFLFEDTINCGNTSELGGGRSSFLPALRILFYLGVRKVFLLGVDFKMAEEVPYHFEQGVPKAGVRTNNRLYALLKDRMDLLQPTFLENDYEVYNCNCDSALTSFPYMAFDDALRICTVEMPASIKDERSEGLYDRHIYLKRPIAPDGRSDVLHHRTPILVRALDVEKVESQNLGVTVGVNETCEWLLEWWFSHYDRYNPFPVEFADFGMSEAAMSWCDKRGIVTEIPKNLPEFKKDWLKKPFAIGASQFDKILWMDLDCEVRGGLQPIFDLIGNDVVLAHDFIVPEEYENLFLRHLYFNTGVVGVHRESNYILMNKWCEKALNYCDQEMGDQELLNLILYEDEAKVVSLDPRFNRLRMMGDRDDVMVMHWTGRKGKEVIRKQIEKSKGD